MIERPRVLVASTKSIKALATADGFRRYRIEVSPDSLPEPISSNVSDQPKSQQESLSGALNRISICRGLFPDYDYYCAIEGGMHCVDFGNTSVWFESACAVVCNTEGDMTGVGFGPSFPIPDNLARLAIQDGADLNTAMQAETGIANIGSQVGFNGWLTGGEIDRRNASSTAVFLALCGLGHEV
jgi:inosine/xanthosine triphosphatase